MNLYNKDWLSNKLSGKTWSYIIKFVAAVICFILFFANSFLIFEEFLSGKTILASNNKPEKSLYFPIIIICNLSAYKYSEMATLELNDYLNNTFVIEDVLESITLGDARNPVQIYNKTYRSEILSISSLYTYYRGHCYKFIYNAKVSILCNSKHEQGQGLALVRFYEYIYQLKFSFQPFPLLEVQQKYRPLLRVC